MWVGVCVSVYLGLQLFLLGRTEHGRESTPHKDNVCGGAVNPDSPPTSLLEATLCLGTERRKEKTESGKTKQ